VAGGWAELPPPSGVQQFPKDPLVHSPAGLKQQELERTTRGLDPRTQDVLPLSGAALHTHMRMLPLDLLTARYKCSVQARSSAEHPAVKYAPAGCSQSPAAGAEGSLAGGRCRP
jgi:hypothetical protein